MNILTAAVENKLLDARLQARALRAIGKIGDAAAIEYLLAAIKAPATRVAAAEALQPVNDPRVKPALDAAVAEQKAVTPYDEHSVWLINQVIERRDGK